MSAARLLACPRMREAVRRDTLALRARLGADTPPPARPRLGRWSALVMVAAMLFLTGCRVTLWSYSWNPGPAFDECEHDRPSCYGTDGPSHNEHGGYIPACDDQPPMIGDDC